jgi:hypothetical protein
MTLVKSAGSYWIWVYWLNPFAWAFRGLTVNEFQSGKYDYPSPVPGLTQGELVLTQIGMVDRNGAPYTFIWAAYSVLLSLLIALLSVIMASICLARIRFASGKSLTNQSIEKNEDEDTKIDVVETELPFQEVVLTFKDMHYTVISSIGKEKIELLKGIDGVVESGKMTALVILLVDCLKFPRMYICLSLFLPLPLQFADGIFWCWKDDFDGCFVAKEDQRGDYW